MTDHNTRLAEIRREETKNKIHQRLLELTAELRQIEDQASPLLRPMATVLITQAEAVAMLLDIV